MKAWLFGVLFGLVVLRAAAQGTLNFANGAAGVNAPVRLAGGGQSLEGARWKAELLLVSIDGSTKRIGEAVPFQTSVGAGYFFGGLVTVPGVEAAASATFRVRAFDTTGTAEATSNPVTISLGGGRLPPANLVGLESWTLKAANPELTIRLAQQTVVLSWSKDFPNAVLEFTDRLSDANWSPMTELPGPGEGNLLVTLPVTVPERYYRLRLK